LRRYHRITGQSLGHDTEPLGFRDGSGVEEYECDNECAKWHGLPPLVIDTDTWGWKSEMHYAFDAKAFKDGDQDPCFIAQNYTPSDQDKNAVRVAYGPNLVAVQTQMKSLLPELPKTIVDARLQAILKIKAELLNE
jgi:hypothetical protein